MFKRVLYLPSVTKSIGIYSYRGIIVLAFSQLIPYIYKQSGHNKLDFCLSVVLIIVGAGISLFLWLLDIITT